MRRHLSTAGLVTLVAFQSISNTAAQTASGAAIRCGQCALTGQKPDTSPVDFSQVAVIDQLNRAVFEGRSLQGDLVARVLSVAPFLLEVLDARQQLVDQNGRVVPNGPPDDDGTCSVMALEAIDRGSRPMVGQLRMNDVITGRVVMHVNSQRPDDFLGARNVLTDVRRSAVPVRYLHTPALPGCANRSGRLLEYRGPSYDSLIVYNDGAIDYRDTLQRHFNREKLSDQEMAELMRAFADAGFDAIPSDKNEPGRGPMPGITLVAARYQDVWFTGKEGRLAPLVTRLKDVVARAMSQTSFLLKPGSPQRLTIEPWPYARIARLDRYMEARNTSRRRRESGETPPGGPWDERVPDAFLDRLPGDLQMPNQDPDPNRFLYFSEDGALYRVTRNPQCRGKEDWWCTSFYALSVEKIESIETRLREQAGRAILPSPPGSSQLRTVADLGPDQLADYNVYLVGDVFLWTGDMFSPLANLPPGGATVPPEDYERHKALYRSLLARVNGGTNLIENGVVYEHVRLCQLESGAIDCPQQ